MAAYLANVGVNAAHRVESPLFADGSFVLYPIPEDQTWAHPMRRLRPRRRSGHCRTSSPRRRSAGPVSLRTARV